MNEAQKTADELEDYLDEYGHLMDDERVEQIELAAKLLTWEGDPVFAIPSRVGNTWRIFHRDKPGRIIAEFHGPQASVMAEHFCKLFGEIKVDTA
jgi:hypothetical protein